MRVDKALKSDIIRNQDILWQFRRKVAIVDDLVHLTMGKETPKSDIPIYIGLLDEMGIHPFI